MSHQLLIIAWLAPLMMLPLVFGRFSGVAMALSALPALLAAILVPVGTGVNISWVLLGMTLHLDETGSWFLLFSSLMWSSAGTYAALTMSRGLARFSAFFLLACAGNLLLIVAADMVTFYVGFALMGLAATGLIADRRSQHARRAARVYLAWTLVGEMALFAAIALLAGEMASLSFTDLDPGSMPNVAVALLLFGFGIKLALPGLHLWLPLAYAAAPAAAASVLSGPMISAGLLGWLRFVPAVEASTVDWGELLIAVGAAGTCLGVLAGLVQRDPRTVLAYSSIAKMGLVTSVFGTALANAAASPAIMTALAVFAMHHLMLKGSLFLGMGEWERRGGSTWLVAVTGILALAMIGVPFTSGAGAKMMLDEATASAGFNLTLLFGFSALGTLLLMARFIWLLIKRPAATVTPPDMASLVWLVLAASALLLPLLQLPMPLSHAGLGMLAASVVLVIAMAGGRGRITLQLPLVPPGDLLYLFRASRRLWSGKLRVQDLRLSPRALVSAGSVPAPVRALGALFWLIFCVPILATMLLSG